MSHPAPRRIAFLALAALLAAPSACKEKRAASGPGAAARSGPEGRHLAASRASETRIPDADRRTLLRLARRSLVSAVSGLDMRSITDGMTITPRLRQVQGAFVTLKKKGRLRGCIGYILPRVPLYRAVIDNARNAAIHDRRFSPVRVGELSDLVIEISALSVPRPVKSYRDIVVGKHGIILRQGSFSATFLPQVATEQRWDIATTLAHLSRKAGLARTAWKEPATRFRVYTAQVWSEPGGEYPIR